LILKMTNSDAPKRSSIHSNFPLYSNPDLQEVEDLLRIIFELLWICTSCTSSVSLIIPDQTIDLLVQKVLQIVSMGVIDHTLIGHGVWVAKNHSVVV
jgi:hypothetical protein